MIKMRMFEVRDPDGNVLWFGQIYHEGQDSPSRRGSQPRGLRQALPELPFDNVPDRDAITILLRARTEQHKGVGSFAVYVDDADALYAELCEIHPALVGPYGLEQRGRRA